MSWEMYPRVETHGSYGFGFFPQFSVGLAWPAPRSSACGNMVPGLGYRPSRCSGGQEALQTRGGLGTIAHVLQVFLSELLSRLLERVIYSIFNQNDAECLGFPSGLWGGPGHLCVYLAGYGGAGLQPG